jgi:hypothetical protein
MIEWFTWLQIGIAAVAGILCIVVGLIGRPPADLTMGATLLVVLLLVGQILVSAVAPALGNLPTGSLLEFWLYLITALLIPPLAIIWGLVDRSRWSTVILGAGSIAVAIMLYRMDAIWFVQVA